MSLGERELCVALQGGQTVSLSSLDKLGRMHLANLGGLHHVRLYIIENPSVNA